MAVFAGGESPSGNCGESSCCCGSIVLTLGSETTDWMSGLTSTRAGTSVATPGMAEWAVGIGLGAGTAELAAMAGGEALVDEGTEAGVAVALAVGAGVAAAFAGEGAGDFAGVLVLAEKWGRAEVGAGVGVGTAAGTCGFASALGLVSPFMQKSSAWPNS